MRLSKINKEIKQIKTLSCFFVKKKKKENRQILLPYKYYIPIAAAKGRLTAPVHSFGYKPIFYYQILARNTNMIVFLERKQKM